MTQSTANHEWYRKSLSIIFCRASPTEHPPSPLPLSPSPAQPPPPPPPPPLLPPRLQNLKTPHPSPPPDDRGGLFSALSRGHVGCVIADDAIDICDLSDDDFPSDDDFTSDEEFPLDDHDIYSHRKIIYKTISVCKFLIITVIICIIILVTRRRQWLLIPKAEDFFFRNVYN